MFPPALFIPVYFMFSVSAFSPPDRISSGNPDGFIEAINNLQDIFIQPFPAFHDQRIRHTVKRFRDASGDAGQRVAVSAERDRRLDHVLEICGTICLELEKNAFSKCDISVPAARLY